MNIRKMLALAATTTAMAGLSLAAAPSASASPASIAACRDHRTAIDSLDPNWHWPPYSYAVTTSNCYDINVRMTQTVDVRTCFQPSSGSSYCNAWRTVYANSWGLAATDVKDGTKFWLLFNTGSARGVAAF